MIRWSPAKLKCTLGIGSLASIGSNKMVLMAFAPTYQHAQIGRTVAKALTGTEGALPDTYGFTAEALAERLNCWKVAHTPTEEGTVSRLPDPAP